MGARLLNNVFIFLSRINQPEYVLAGALIVQTNLINSVEKGVAWTRIRKTRTVCSRLEIISEWLVYPARAMWACGRNGGAM